MVDIRRHHPYGPAIKKSSDHALHGGCRVEESQAEPLGINMVEMADKSGDSKVPLSRCIIYEVFPCPQAIDYQSFDAVCAEENSVVAKEATRYVGARGGEPVGTPHCSITAVTIVCISERGHSGHHDENLCDHCCKLKLAQESVALAMGCGD